MIPLYIPYFNNPKLLNAAWDSIYETGEIEPVVIDNSPQGFQHRRGDILRSATGYGTAFYSSAIRAIDALDVRGGEKERQSVLAGNALRCGGLRVHSAAVD